METPVKYRLDCGCEIDIVDPALKPIDSLPSLDVDYYSLREDCPLAWDVFHSGQTKGVFQLETQLGRKFSKDLAPSNLLEASALIALIRPGCLRYVVDGKSMTQHYIDRKHGREDTVPVHPALTEILSETYQIICYQENVLEISKQIAGFNLQEADKLRKAMGTKDAAMMASIRDKFVAGCEKVGLVGKEDAVALFDNIEKSNRYSFNKCLHPNTRVITFYNNKLNNTRLQCLEIGDMVLGPNGFTKVVNIYHNPVKLIHRFILEDNLKIRCSEDHKLMTKYGLRTAKEIFNQHLEVKTLLGWQKIKRIEFSHTPIKNIDIEVEDSSHTFYADNILVSNSHSYEYAVVGYWTAWMKAHFPLHFYTAWLTYAKQKIEHEKEVSDLVADAKRNNIHILTPTVKKIVPEFTIEGSNIRFGFGLVKGLGGSNLKKLADTINKRVYAVGKPINQFNIAEFMFLVSPAINKTVMTNIVLAGALDELGLDRKRILYYYDIILALTDKEIEQIVKLTSCKESLLKSLQKLLAEGKIGAARRVKIESLVTSLQNPPYSLEDTTAFRVNSEVEILGTAISSSSLENCAAIGNTTCEQFLNGKKGEEFTIPVEIVGKRENIIKNGQSAGKTMAFIAVKDLTGDMDMVIFSDAYTKYQNLLIVGNTVMMTGKRSKTDSFAIEKVVQI